MGTTDQDVGKSVKFLEIMVYWICTLNRIVH